MAAPGRECTVCASPARRKIDKALASGTSHRELAKKHELGRAAIGRHAASHLVRAVAVAVDAREVSRGDALLATALGWESELAELYQLAKAARAFGAAASIARTALAAMAFRLQVAEVLTDPRDVTGTAIDADDNENRERFDRALGIA